MIVAEKCNIDNIKWSIVLRFYDHYILQVDWFIQLSIPSDVDRTRQLEISNKCFILERDIHLRGYGVE